MESIEEMNKKVKEAKIDWIVNVLAIFDMVSRLKSALLAENKTHVSFFVETIKDELNKLNETYGEVQS